MSVSLPIPGNPRIPRTGTPGGFGFRRTPTHQHQGIDLSVPVGTPWLALDDGVVEHANNLPYRPFAGYGRALVLRLDTGERVLYAHGLVVNVTEGMRVFKGHKVGEVGRSRWLPFPDGHPQAGQMDVRDDNRMGAHLHLEIATHRYPMGSEAPYRIDPHRWFQERYDPAAGSISKVFTSGGRMSAATWVLIGVTVVATGAVAYGTYRLLR